MKYNFICALLLSWWSLSSHATISEQLASTLTGKQAMSDVDQMVAFISQTHPDLTYTLSKGKSFAQHIADLKKSLDGPVSQRELWLKLMQLNSQFNDGHLSVTPSELREAIYECGVKDCGLFPFKVVADDGYLVIQSKLDGSESKLKGYKLLSINGRTMDEVLAPLLEITHGDSDIQKMAILASRFYRYYWLYFGQQNTFTLDIERKIKLQNVEVKPSVMEIERPDRSFEGVYNFEIRDQTALLTIKSFRRYKDKLKLQAFFNNAFKTIKERGVTTLLIDIRRNGGGDDPVWMEGILPYVADKPWRIGSKYKAKVLKGQDKEGLKVGQVVDGELDNFSGVDNKTPYRFTGKVFVLVDNFTYSSSILFINVMQDFGFGEIVGDTIGGKRGQTGGVQKTVLQHSKLKVVSPRFLLERPAGGGNLALVSIDHVIEYDKTEPEQLIKSATELLVGNKGK